MKKITIIGIFLLFSGFLAGQNHYVNVHWEPPPTGAFITGYRVYRFLTPADTLNPIDSVTTSSSSTSVRYTGLQTGTNYYFRVRAFNNTDRSPISDPLAGKILARGSVSSAVTTGLTNATISWTTLDPAHSILKSPPSLGQVKFSTDSLGLLQGSAGFYSPIDSTASSSLSVTITGLSEGTKYYYFLIEQDTAGNLISSEVLSFTTGQFVNPDPYEDNNSFALATTLPVPANIQAYIIPVGDPDYYRVQVPEKVDSLLILCNPPANKNLDMVIDLYSASQSALATENKNGMNQGELMIYLNPPAGTYYIRITDNGNNDSSSTPYSLQVDVSYQDSTVDTPNPDPYEENNSFEQATVFVPDSNYSAYIFPAGDPDYYRFSRSTSSSKILLQVSQAPFPLSLELFNSSLESVGLYNTSNGSFSAQLEVPDGFYLVIRALSASDESSTASYRLKFQEISDTIPSFDPEKPVFAGPNPFVKGKTNDSGFHFTNIIPGMKIHIYTLSLEKVWEKEITASDGAEIVWQMINSQGREIASGVYLVVVYGSDGKVVEQTKLVYIR